MKRTRNRVCLAGDSIISKIILVSVMNFVSRIAEVDMFFLECVVDF